MPTFPFIIQCKDPVNILRFQDKNNNNMINEDLNMDLYNINALCCLFVMVFLLVLVSVFAIKWRHDATPIMQVLALLLINEIFYSASEVLGYLDKENNILCTISIIGRMSFSVAANFWIIFITRLVYIQALAPGKNLNLLNFIFKNIIFTYVPSLILSIFLLIVINISATQSEKKCWQIITDKQALDYVIYLTTFILPNLVTSVVILVYMFLLYRLSSRKWTLFLLFSITSLFFSIYYITIKLYQLINQNSEMVYFNLVMLGQPIVYGVFFILAYCKQKKKLTTSSDITIRGSEGEASFIQDL